MPIEDPYFITIILRFLIPGLYFISSAGYIIHFVKSSEKLPVWVKPVFLSGFLLHLLLFLLLLKGRGTIPLTTVFEGLFFCSLILSALYLFIERVVNETCYGAFLLPINFIISVIAVVYLHTGKPLPDSLTSVYFVFHASFLFTAYTCFFLSFIISVMYLIQHHEIKKRHLGILFKRLPALENMDISIARVDAFGLGLLFLGIIIGFLWLDFAPDSVYRMNVKIGFTILTAAIYLIEHLLRVTKGLKGRRATLFSITGFIFILITLVIGRHGH